MSDYLRRLWDEADDGVPPTEELEAFGRIIEKQKAKLEALRAALLAGEESGLVEDFDPQTALSNLHADHKKPA